MTIIRIATPSPACAKAVDVELRGRGYQSAPSGIFVSTTAPRAVVEREVENYKSVEKIIAKHGLA
jgi:hypothetical protein